MEQRWKGTFINMEVIDWSGPIVETSFNRPVQSDADTEQLFKEGREFLQNVVRPKADKVYFLTCYDNLQVPRDLVRSFQDRLVDFNLEFSKGDERWGGNDAVHMFIITTSIRSSTGSNIHAERERALETLRDLIMREHAEKA